MSTAPLSFTAPIVRTARAARGIAARPARMLMLACVLGLAACQTPPPPPAPVAKPTGFGPEQVAVLKQLGFKEGPQSWDIGLADKILFEVDQDKLSADAVKKVEQMGKTLASVSIVTMRVEGHTDASGRAEYNNTLSQRRADAVAASLANAGLPRSGITAKGMGSTHPVADNTTAAGRAENRRVAIVVPVPTN
ncbi:MAG: OmpA family protein [Pseudomonadota bacterium]